MAGSTHQGEESIISEVFGKLKKEIKELVLIIAPRNPERAESVYGIYQSAGYSAVQLKDIHRADSAEGYDVIIIDIIGILNKLYSIADVAFIGGSLVKRGGHNPLEPAAFSKPIIFGPYMSNFAEISDMLLKAGAARQVLNAADFYEVASRLLLDKKESAGMGKNAYAVFADNKGAVEKIINEIEDTSILDGKIKVVTNSLLSRLVSIDYFNMYLSTRLSISKFKTRFGLNGVCFAIKREKFFELKGFKKTITEDADFGVRASIADADMKFSNNLELYTQSPNTWKEWYKQRKRWAIGGSMCILDHFKYLFLKPKIWIPILFTVYPSFIYIFIYMVLPDYIIYKLISLVLIFLVFVLPVGVISLVLFTFSFGIVIAKAAFLAFITFVIWSAIILLGYKKHRWSKIRLYDLPIYYFIYSPIWFFISCLYFIKVCMARIRKKEIKLEDWKI